MLFCFKNVSALHVLCSWGLAGAANHVVTKASFDKLPNELTLLNIIKKKKKKKNMAVLNRLGLSTDI